MAGADGAGMRALRRVAAGSAMIALACAVAVVLHGDGRLDALLSVGTGAVAELGRREPAAVDPAPTEELHWGHKWLKNAGLLHETNWHPGCSHMFRDLCNERYYHHPVHPYLQHKSWLDTSTSLERAHEYDEQQEVAFQQATKELHNQVMVSREDWNQEMKELHQAQTDKYSAYFLHLQAEKNKTAEILSAWETKRDEELAKIDADYVEKVANVSTGREEYQKIYDDAEKADAERQATFKNMIEDMKEAGSSAKDIATATLAFRSQEAKFQQKLKSIRTSFDAAKVEKRELTKEAHEEVAKFKAQQKKEQLQAIESERRYQEEQANEKAAAEKTASSLLHERAEVNAVEKQAHSYSEDLKATADDETQRQNSLEKAIREAKDKEQMHAKKMQERALADEAKSEALRNGKGLKDEGHDRDVKEVSSFKNEYAKHLKAGRVAAVKYESGTEKTAAVVKKAKPADATATKVKQAKTATQSKKDAQEASRQAAFLKALSQQADAEFHAEPAKV